MCIFSGFLEWNGIQRPSAMRSSEPCSALDHGCESFCFAGYEAFEGELLDEKRWDAMFHMHVTSAVVTIRVGEGG